MARPAPPAPRAPRSWATNLTSVLTPELQPAQVQPSDPAQNSVCRTPADRFSGERWAVMDRLAPQVRPRPRPAPPESFSLTSLLVSGGTQVPVPAHAPPFRMFSPGNPRPWAASPHSQQVCVMPYARPLPRSSIMSLPPEVPAHQRCPAPINPATPPATMPW